MQAVLGRVGADEELSDVVTVPMRHAGSDELGELFVADTTVPHSGAVGYTVRVLPHHPLLASDAEPGLLAVPHL